jgi:hypothetical protein
MTLRQGARLVAEHAPAPRRLYRLVGFTLIAAGVILSSQVALADCPGCPEDCDTCFDCSTLDCDDGDPCTLDECDEVGGCINGPVDCEEVECLTCPDDCGPCEDCSTLDCNDGDLCTSDECDPSVGCVNDPVDCDDDDQCTVNSCSPGTGCQATPVLCDDGEPCTEDGCDPSTGCIVESATCDDGSECTVDSCDPTTGCVHEYADCDDGDPCTDDGCDPTTGQCLTSPKSCDDGDPCTDDGCDPTTGQCLTSPKSCDDDDACTDGVCDPVLGECIYTPKDCVDDDLCTSDECDPSVGCINDPVDCDDDDQCTVNSCSPGTGCQATPVLCDDGEPCTEDGCDPSAGCIVESATCDDGSECTVDSCDPTTGCVHEYEDCDDGDPCTDDGCDPTTGQCLTSPKSCDDDDACTDGVCDPVLEECIYTPKDCVDDDLCTGESCDPLDGCTYEPVACDDGSLCTESGCEPASGCQYTALDCGDADLCTDDFCDPGTGCFSLPVNCDDGNECSIDACDPTTGGCLYQPNCDEPSCEVYCECTWPEPEWTDVELTVPTLELTLPNSEAVCEMLGLNGKIASSVALEGSLERRKFIGETPQEKCQDSTSGDVAFTWAVKNCGKGFERKVEIGGDVTDHLCPHCPPVPPSEREWQCLEAGYRDADFYGEFTHKPEQLPQKKLTLANKWVKLQAALGYQGHPVTKGSLGLGWTRQLDADRDEAADQNLACPESPNCVRGKLGAGGALLASGWVKGELLGWATLIGTAWGRVNVGFEGRITRHLDSTPSSDGSAGKCAEETCLEGKAVFSFGIKAGVALRWTSKRHPGGSFSLGSSFGYTCERDWAFLSLGCAEDEDKAFACPDPSYSKRGPFCCKWIYPWDACEETTCKQENRYCGEMPLRCSDGVQDCGGCDDGAECVDFVSLTNEHKNHHDRLDRPNADIPPLPETGTVCCRKRTCENLNPGPVDYEYLEDRHVTPYPPTVPADGQAECGVFSDGCTDDKIAWAASADGLLSCGDCEEKNVGDDTNYYCSEGKCECNPSDSCEENGWECGWHHTGCPHPENPHQSGTVYCGETENYGKTDYEAGYTGLELGCEIGSCCNEKKSKCYKMEGTHTVCGGKDWWNTCLSEMPRSCGTVSYPSMCGQNITKECQTPPSPYVCVKKPVLGGEENFWDCPVGDQNCVAQNSRLIYKRCQWGAGQGSCVSFKDPIACHITRDCSFGLSEEMIDCCQDDKSWEQCCSENPGLEGCT